MPTIYDWQKWHFKTWSFTHVCTCLCALSCTHTHTQKKKRSMTMKCTFSHQQSFTRLHFYVQWDTAKMENSSASVSKVYATFFVVIITHMHTQKKTLFLMTNLVTKSRVYPQRQLQGNANRMQGLGNMAPWFSVLPSWRQRNLSLEETPRK